MTSQPKSESPMNPLDEFPALSAYIKHITDFKSLFNYVIYGAMQKTWAETMEQSIKLAIAAHTELTASKGETDDIILPNWADETTKELLGTQRMSADAWLDFLQLQGEQVERDLYDEPPPESH